MHRRVLPLLALLFLCFTTAALADIEIKKARYGNTTVFKDVRGIVTAYLRNNTLSFPVNSRSMGGDPGMGTDFLFVVYNVNGREFTDTIPQGGVFTFRGVPNVRPVQPPLNLPFLKPIAPTTAQLIVSNRSHRLVRAYNVDRFGQWVWAANISSGQSLAFQARVGEQWVIADYSNRVLAQQRIARGDNRIVTDDPEPYNPPGGSYPPGGFRKHRSDRY